ncbi:hypothetical protein M0802_015603 [Mischocyttarus mexicanus]|nr:hypothetical protein M0802_015603 [Mischocyttarus mexicanus]
MAAKIALQEQRAATITGILLKTKDLSAMDLATAERTRGFLEANWKKLDAENEKIYQSSREPTFGYPYFKEGRYEATMHSHFAGLSVLNRHITALAPPASPARVHEQVLRGLVFLVGKGQPRHLAGGKDALSPLQPGGRSSEGYLKSQALG